MLRSKKNGLILIIHLMSNRGHRVGELAGYEPNVAAILVQREEARYATLDDIHSASRDKVEEVRKEPVPVSEDENSSDEGQEGGTAPEPLFTEKSTPEDVFKALTESEDWQKLPAADLRVAAGILTEETVRNKPDAIAAIELAFEARSNG